MALENSGSTPSCAPRSRSCALRARACCASASRSGAGSSATCTTAPSSGWCRWRSTLRLARGKVRERPRGRRRLLERRRRGARGGARGAARAGPRHPPGGADRPRPGHRARDAGAPRRRCRSSCASCPRERLPEPIELAAYFVVSEALTNVAKYAQRQPRRRSASARDERPRSWSRWPTTASAGRTRSSGTGLRGLADRLAVLEGRLEIDSHARRGHRRYGRGCRARSGRRRLGAPARGRGPAARGVRLRGGRRRPATPRTCCARSTPTSPDVAVVDIRMPPTNTDEGLRAALKIRAEPPRHGRAGAVPVRRAGLRARAGRRRRRRRRLPAQGPRGGRGRFVDSVKRVAEGGTALDPEVVAQLVGRRPARGSLDELTPREREVLGADGGGPIEHGDRRTDGGHGAGRREARDLASSANWASCRPPRTIAACSPFCTFLRS